MTKNTRMIHLQCMKNHALNLGRYVVDGCAEFFPAGSSPDRCAACGCHRGFHRPYLLIDLDSEEKEGGGVRNRDGDDGKGFPSPPPGFEKAAAGEGGIKRKSKFTLKQRVAMRWLAERMKWSMRNEEEEGQVQTFCEKIGVTKTMFKNWVNNNKRPASSRSSNVVVS